MLAFAFSTVLHGQSAEDATAIANRFIEGVTKAWEARDGRAYAAAFWPDAEIVNVFGGVMAGEQVIAARMNKILKGALNARDSKQTIRKVRMLAPNVIVVDTVNTDAGNAAGGGDHVQVHPGEAGERMARRGRAEHPREQTHVLKRGQLGFGSRALRTRRHSARRKEQAPGRWR